MAVHARPDLGHHLAHRQAEPRRPGHNPPDLADVELALARLDGGTYWTCEATGEVLPDELLAERPTARRLP